jgi:AAA domain
MHQNSSGKDQRWQEYETAAFRMSTAERAGYDGDGTSKPRARSRKAKATDNVRQRNGVIHPDPQPTEGGSAGPHGRLASTLAGTELAWFVPGWFARSMLSVIIGRKNVGKSSCLAWLLAKAQRPVILPGYEESVELMMLPRWRAANVLLRSLLVLNDQHYSPSLQIGLIVSILQRHRADLLVIENMDSYLPADHSTNDSQAVRPYLEGLHSIAVQSGVPVIGTRHPGKDPANLCPGSHCWEDVPRISVVLESEGNPATRYWLWSHRCGVGSQPDPLGYTLPRNEVGVPVFKLAEKTDTSALRIAQIAPDPIDRSRLQSAMDMLSRLLQDGSIEGRLVFAEAEKERLGEGTIRRAAIQLGVVITREGSGLNHGSTWQLPGAAAPWSASDLP